jgi:hypothetical protein
MKNLVFKIVILALVAAPAFAEVRVMKDPCEKQITAISKVIAKSLDEVETSRALSSATTEERTYLVEFSAEPDYVVFEIVLDNYKKSRCGFISAKKF